MILLLLVLCAAVFYLTGEMSSGAELFPRITAFGLAFFGIVELILSLSRKDSMEKPIKKENNQHLVRKSVLYMLVFFLLVIFFFLCFPLIGFEVSAIGFMLIAMVLLGGRKTLRLWPVAILIPLLLVLVFRGGLDVRLPTLFF